jgi:uncharacterized membrane protein YedE/YeeE
MENFTPVAGLIGGALIGLSAVLMLAMNGRIAGISGIFSGLLSFTLPDLGWRLAFILGLVIGPLLYVFAGGATPEISIRPELPVLITAGVLVGMGTRIGGGCTSGHGVCGIARLSKRSIVATITFMIVAIATVAIINQLRGG